MKLLVACAALAAAVVAHPGSGSSSSEANPMGDFIRSLSPADKEVFVDEMKEQMNNGLKICLKDTLQGDGMQSMMHEKEAMVAEAMGLMGEVGQKLPADLQAKFLPIVEAMKEKMQAKMMAMQDKFNAMMQQKMGGDMPASRPKRSMRQLLQRLNKVDKEKLMKNTKLAAVLKKMHVKMESKMEAQAEPEPKMAPMDDAMMAEMSSKAEDAMALGMEVMHKCHCKHHPKGPMAPETMAEAGEVMAKVMKGDDEDEAMVADVMDKVTAFLESEGEAELLGKMKRMKMMKEKCEKMKRVAKAVSCVVGEIKENRERFDAAVDLVTEHPHESMMVAHCVYAQKKELFMRGMVNVAKKTGKTLPPMPSMASGEDMGM